MNCKEKGCKGKIDKNNPIDLRIGCQSGCCCPSEPACPCEVCGRLYWDNGKAVKDRQKNRAFLKNGKLVHKDKNGNIAY